MTRGEIKTLISYWVDDLDKGYFSDAQLNVFINNAQKETQKQLVQAGELYFERCVETTTVASQQDYIVPDDFLKVNRIELVLSGSGVNEDKLQLEPITLNQQNLVYTKLGNPSFYALKRDRFMLFPIPDRAKTLRLYYTYRIPDMDEDSDTPDIPLEYHEHIALIACRDCFIKDDRPMGNLKDKLDAYERLFKQMAEDRKQDRPRHVVITEDYGGYNY